MSQRLLLPLTSIIQFTLPLYIAHDASTTSLTDDLTARTRLSKLKGAPDTGGMIMMLLHKLQDNLHSARIFLQPQTRKKRKGI